MESTNLHHQDQPPTPEPSSSLSTAIPSIHGAAALAGTSHSWSPNFILNAGGNNPRSRLALTDNNDVIGVPLIQDSGYHHQWMTTSEDEDAPQSCLTTTTNQSTAYLHLDQLQQQHHHLSLKIKEEISLPKFSSSDSEMLNMIPSTMEAYGLVTTTTTSRTTTRHMKNIIEHHKDNSNNADDDLNDKLLLKTLFPGDLYSTTNNAAAAQNNYYPHHDFVSNSRGVPSRGGNFSQIYPSINISNLNHQPSSNSTVADLVSSPAMESLDLLTSPSSRSFITTDADLSLHHHSHQHLGRFADNLSFRLLDHMQHHTIDSSFSTSASNSSSNPSSTSSSHFPNGTAEVVGKRPCTSSMELEPSSKASQSQTATKKSRSESRPSCPPLKVRKEKLGDRIAALQQLVAPFGKTDTASVLMEAIGYIKFLQSQVETLSVPYMKKSSSQNQTNRSVMQKGSGGCIGGNGEEKIDLGSRGLCLMPLSCISYIAADAATDVWQH